MFTSWSERRMSGANGAGVTEAERAAKGTAALAGPADALTATTAEPGVPASASRGVFPALRGVAAVEAAAAAASAAPPLERRRVRAGAIRKGGEGRGRAREKEVEFFFFFFLFRENEE